ncbi:MAG: hypothetical protein ACTHY0_07480, partial [Mammaliicoccus vitulinus]
MPAIQKKRNKFMPNFERPSIYSLELGELED